MEERWNGSADTWAEWEHILEPAFSSFNEVMFEYAGIHQGTRVLDLACGVGGLAIEAARRGAEVTGTDIAARMIFHARQKDSHVNWLVADNEDSLTGGPWDVITCRFGAFFFDDAEAWLKRARAALTPGGRIVLGLWVPGGVPLCDVPRGVAEAVFGTKPAADAPGPSRYGGPGGWMSMLNKAGFEGIGLRGVDVPTDFGTPGAAVRFMEAMAGDLSEQGTTEQVATYWAEVEKQLPFDQGVVRARAAVVWAQAPGTPESDGPAASRKA